MPDSIHELRVCFVGESPAVRPTPRSTQIRFPSAEHYYSYAVRAKTSRAKESCEVAFLTGKWGPILNLQNAGG